MMNYKILNIDYEPQWKILYVDGYIDSFSEKIESIEVYYLDEFIGILSYGFRFNNKFIKYKGEFLFVKDKFDKKNIIVKYLFKEKIIEDRYISLEDRKKVLNFSENVKRKLKIYKYKYFFNKIEPRRLGRDKIIMLFIHNLEYEERIQKLRCFELLDLELKKFGWSLLIVHHSLNKLPTKIKTVELKDLELPFYYKMCNRSIFKKLSKDFEIAVDFLDSHEKAFNKDLIYSISYDRVKDEFYKTKFLIDKYKPYGVLNWHEWSSFQYMSRAYCKYMNISEFCVHEGALFDTLEIDKKGELAESWIFDDIKLFNSLKVEEGDINKAKNLIEKIKNKNLNRKHQSNLSFIKELLEPLKNKKIIFFAGVNDAQTGMLPVWYENAKKHSKLFVDSYDALNYLSKLAEKNDWYILFKPHPNVPVRNKDFINDRVIYVKDANALECIKHSDITITLLSTLSYDVLINNKPLVLLGENLMSKSNSAYEIDSIYDVQKIIEDALDKKDFAEKRDSFLLHVARLLKYYYFPYSLEAQEFCYRDFNDTARYLIKNSSQGEFFA